MINDYVFLYLDYETSQSVCKKQKCTYLFQPFPKYNGQLVDALNANKKIVVLISGY